jgi:hypothetical protein
VPVVGSRTSLSDDEPLHDEFTHRAADSVTADKAYVGDLVAVAAVGEDDVHPEEIVEPTPVGCSGCGAGPVPGGVRSARNLPDSRT